MAEPSKISDSELKKLFHKSEDSRFDLALFTLIPIIGIAALLIVSIEGGFMLLFVVATLVAAIWFTLQMVKAQLTSNAVKVSKHNFPEIHALLEEVKDALDFKPNVDIYIVEEGTVNAFLARFFQTKIIILNSELVRDMIEKESLLQLKWVIARFVGALRAKHDRLAFFRVLIESIESIKLFNLLLLPYERATQYSGDQIGLAVCGDVKQVMLAFQKLMVGNDLAKRVRYEGIMEQKRSMGFFAMLARFTSTHPHTIDRFYNLLAFAKQKYPAAYETYMNDKQK